LIHPRGPYGGDALPISIAEHGWLYLHEGVFTSALAKNSENQLEYDNIIDAMV
jgi:hypothetical protein